MPQASHFTSGHEAVQDLFSDKHPSVQLESASQLSKHALRHTRFVIPSIVQFWEQSRLHLFTALLQLAWHERSWLPQERMHCGSGFAEAASGKSITANNANLIVVNRKQYILAS
ncbi:MAG: hypothetical protein LLG15_07355 [Betaproteobacteria bacterium]|nr:hypothetical protein [Betaproteobacteria bacterium]